LSKPETAARIDGEVLGGINVAELLARSGTISKKVKLEVIDNVLAWKQEELKGVSNG
jgi:hypothetical protein